MGFCLFWHPTISGKINVVVVAIVVLVGTYNTALVLDRISSAVRKGINTYYSDRFRFNLQVTDS